MPPKDFNISDAKLYIDGKEIPCQSYEFKYTGISEDVDDFGLHFNQNKEISLSCESYKFNSIELLKLLGIWDNLKWYQKLRIVISDWFRFR